MPDRPAVPAAAEGLAWAAVANEYRVEADQVISEYDALELDAGIMQEALEKIAAGRRNKRFDPWAQQIAREALGQVSDRTRSMSTGAVQ